MTNKQAQELRDIASAATSAPLWHAVGIFGEVVDPANQEWKSVHDFWKTFTAERVLALLDELEAKDKRITELEAREVTLPPTFWYEHDDLSRDVPVLDKRLVKKAIRAAGIRINGEG